MALMTWTDDFSVELDSIDAQHHRLIDLINELHDAMLAGKAQEELKTILDGLLDYTKTHFGYEEKLMVENEYPEYEAHKAVHDALAAKVVELDEKLAAGEHMLSMEVMTFLKDWLTHHIMGMDKQYSPFMLEHGVN